MTFYLLLAMAALAPAIITASGMAGAWAERRKISRARAAPPSDPAPSSYQRPTSTTPHSAPATGGIR